MEQILTSQNRHLFIGETFLTKNASTVNVFIPSPVMMGVLRIITGNKHAYHTLHIMMHLHNYNLPLSEQTQLSGITKTCLFKYTENLTTKIWIFSDKKFWYFHISAQNIDWGYSLEPPRWDGSNEYPQSMFLSRNKKNNVNPCKPQFYYIKVGFKGVKII